MCWLPLFGAVYTAQGVTAKQAEYASNQYVMQLLCHDVQHYVGLHTRMEFAVAYCMIERLLQNAHISAGAERRTIAGCEVLW